MEIIPKRNWQFPLALEREYAKLLVAYVDKEVEIVEEFLPEMADAVYRNSVRSDAVGDWLGNLVDRVQRKIKQKLNVLPAIRRIFQKVNQHVSRQMTETFESVFGTRPRQLNNTRELEMTKTIWTSQNLTLISSIDQQVLDKLRFMLSQRIIHAAAKPELVEQLTKEIGDLAGVTRNRAALIGADQVGKLNSQLTQYRQTNAGIEEYIWTTKKDKRVRPRHALREGRRYKWSEPPDDGHPGWPIRCRCTAAPVFDTDRIGVQPKAGSYKGLGSGKKAFITETKMTETMPVDFEDNQAIDSMFARFAKEIAPTAEREYAIIVTRSNKSFWLEGGTGTVNIEKAGNDLYGAKVIHSHPDDEYGTPGDCFSREDMGKADRVRFGLSRISIQPWQIPSKLYGEKDNSLRNVVRI